MKKQWIVALGILALVFVSPAQALDFTDDTCPDTGGTEFIVDTAAEAATVANGYDFASCNLIIKTSLTGIVDTGLPITANTIEIEGPDVLDASKSVEIINDNAASKIFLTAKGKKAGDICIKIKEGSIKARSGLKIECKAADGIMDVDDSELIASLNLDTVSTGGTLTIISGGNISIENTTTYGGDSLHITSQNGSVTWFCPGGGGCKLPSQSSKLKEKCGDPPVFPCNVTFNSSKEADDFCRKGVVCGGGRNEIGVSAKLDVDIRGSTINSTNHCFFTSREERILAGPRNSEKTNITCKNLRMTAKKTIDITEATLTASANAAITAGSGCPAVVGDLDDPAEVCINADKADIEAKEITMTANKGNGGILVCDATLEDIGIDFPTLNGVSSPPYEPVPDTVADTAGDCAAFGKGAATIN